MCKLGLTASSKYLFSSPFWHLSSNGWSNWGMIRHLSLSIGPLYMSISGFFIACQAQSTFPRCIFQKSNTKAIGFLWYGSGNHIVLLCHIQLVQSERVGSDSRRKGIHRSVNTGRYDSLEKAIFENLGTEICSLACNCFYPPLMVSPKSHSFVELGSVLKSRISPSELCLCTDETCRVLYLVIMF